jgi:hypothetical protein
LPDLFLSSQRRPRLQGRSLGLLNPGLGRCQPGLRLIDRILQPGRVELGEKLSLLHPVIVVDVDVQDDARLFGADFDLVGRGEIAGRRDDHGQVAALDRAGCIGGLVVAAENQPPQDDQHHDDGKADADPAEQHRARRCRLDAEEVVQILLGLLVGIGHQFLVSAGAGCFPPS